MKKKQKKFKRFRIPRYLKGQVTDKQRYDDLDAFNDFRKRVFTARAEIDARPPFIHPNTFLNDSRMKSDLANAIKIQKENRNLLYRIVEIHQNIGEIDSYNPTAYDRESNWPLRLKRLKEIDRENKILYEKFNSIISSFNNKLMEELWQANVSLMAGLSKYPLTFLIKTSMDDVFKSSPSISGHLEKLDTEDRPRCFLTFKLRGGKELGSIEIELYRDYAPNTVENFLAYCDPYADMNYIDCPVHRIVPGQFIETGDITKGTGRGGTSIFGPFFQEEPHCLRHTRAGVLSTVRRGISYNNSIFAISLNKLEKLDHQNVVFGKVVKGNDHIMKFDGYGRKVGKPLAEIYISNCGILKKK